MVAVASDGRADEFVGRLEGELDGFDTFVFEEGLVVSEMDGEWIVLFEVVDFGAEIATGAMKAVVGSSGAFVAAVAADSEAEIALDYVVGAAAAAVRPVGQSNGQSNWLLALQLTSIVAAVRIVANEMVQNLSRLKMYNE